MESSKIIFIFLLVLPTVLAQSTSMTTIELTDLQTTAEFPTEAPTALGEIVTTQSEEPENPTTSSEAEATTTAGKTEATDPDQTEAPATQGKTEAVDPNQTQAPTTSEKRETVDPDAPTTAGQTEGPNPQQTTSEVSATTVQPEEVILSVTTALVSYPDDKILTVGGGALVTVTATVEIISDSVDFIDDMKVIVYAADSQMEELSTGIEVSLEPYNLTINESMSFNKLNATLALDDVVCTDFTHVCVRVEPASDAVWKISAEGSTDRSCDEISCESGSTRLVVSGLLMVLCLFISRMSSDNGD